MISTVIATLPAVQPFSANYFDDISQRNNSLVTTVLPQVNTVAGEMNATAATMNSQSSQVATDTATAVAAMQATVAAANFQGTFDQGVDSALAGQSWSYAGVTYRVLVNTANNPILEPTSWVALTEPEETLGTVASAATTTIGAFGGEEALYVTGTATITSFGFSTTGIRRTLIFTNASVVTHNATSLICLGSAGFTGMPGMVIDVICINGALGYWQVLGMVHPSVGMGELMYLDGLSSPAVGTTQTQTLSNKTLTSPTINGVVFTGIAADIHSATEEAIGDTDEFGFWDSFSLGLRKISWANLKAALGVLFAPLNNPIFTGLLTSPLIASNTISSSKATVSITSWSYVTTTITLNVASHTFVAGDFINISGLTATTGAPYGVYLVTSVTATTIVFSVPVAPTGTAGVSSALCAGYVVINGVAGGIGIGQTWQDKTASRAISTSYINSTGKPIMVSISTTSAVSTVAATLTIDGVVVANVVEGHSNTSRLTVAGIVPNGSTYSYATRAIGVWAELT